MSEVRRGRLIVGELSVQGSAVQNMERPTPDDEVSDTIQWWLTDERCWRIRTFACDHDIQVYRFDAGRDRLEQQAWENTRKHYGEILRRLESIDIADASAGDAVTTALRAAGLGGSIEVGPDFVFWNPDDARYRTQSEPPFPPTA